MTAVRAKRDFWTDETEQGRTLGVVYDNPRREGEGTMQYMERVAILAGLMPALHAAFPENRAHVVTASKAPAVDARLPYRDDFE